MSKCQSCLKTDVKETKVEKLRTWILQKFFRKELQDYRVDFYNQGVSQGFKNGHELAMRIAREDFAEQLKNLQPEHKLPLAALAVEDVLTADATALYSNKVKMTKEQIEILKGELHQWKQMRLRTLLISTPECQAKEKMFEKSTCWEDMLAGKGILYSLNVQTKIEDLIEKAKV